MDEESQPDFFAKGEITKNFNAEYHPLEALLACIIDGQRTLASPPSRQIRIRNAYKALTDQDVDRVDDPSGKHARALYRMAERRYEEYRSQLLPQFGGTDGEPLEELDAKALAQHACQRLGLPDNDVDILVRKYNARYGKDPRAKTETYAMLPIDRLNAFEAVQESELLADFAIIGRILAKYGIELTCATSFGV